MTHSELDPFPLSQVLTQLPKKQVEVNLVPLIPEQLELYNDLKRTFSEEVERENSEERPKRVGASMLMELRKAANHQLLLRRKYDDKKLRQMAKLMLTVSTNPSVKLGNLPTIFCPDKRNVWKETRCPLVRNFRTVLVLFPGADSL